VRKWLAVGLLVSALVSNALSQELTPLLQALEAGRFKEVRQALDSLAFRYPGHPGVLYLQARTTRNAALAAGIYKTIVRNHPRTRWAVYSNYFLGQYYYAQGLYHQCRRYFKPALKKLRRTDYIQTAMNQLLRADIAARLLDSGKVDLAWARRQFVGYEFDVPQELKAFDRVPEAAPAPAPAAAPRKLGEPVEQEQRSDGNYALQAGAFSKRNNAEALLSEIRGTGRDCKIVVRTSHGTRLYLVWITGYTTRREAEQDRLRLQKELGLSTFPVPLK